MQTRPGWQSLALKHSPPDATRSVDVAHARGRPPTLASDTITAATRTQRARKQKPRQS